MAEQGLAAAVLVAAGLLLLFFLGKLVWKAVESHWADVKKELSDEKTTLSPRLVQQLGDAVARSQFGGALTSAEALLARWYGQHPCGKASFERALAVAFAYPILLLLAGWQAGCWAARARWARLKS